MEIPKKPKVYCTGNTKKAVENFKDSRLNTKLYGVVGPIVGVTGLLLGMSKKGMNSVAFLAETYGHPMYLGVKGAKEILSIFNKKFKFSVKIDKLDDEIKAMEEEALKRTEDLAAIQNKTAPQTGHDVNYIG